MDESAIFIAGWVLTGVVALAAIGLVIYQAKTGKKWSANKTARVLSALKGVGTTLAQALEDGKISRDEMRLILESTVLVLAEVASKDPEEVAAEIPGASEQIHMLDDITADTSTETPVAVEQK